MCLLVDSEVSWQTAGLELVTSCAILPGCSPTIQKKLPYSCMWPRTVMSTSERFGSLSMVSLRSLLKFTFLNKTQDRSIWGNPNTTVYIKIYLHFPFPVSYCNYTDFSLHASGKAGLLNSNFGNLPSSSESYRLRFHLTLSSNMNSIHQEKDILGLEKMAHCLRFPASTWWFTCNSGARRSSILFWSPWAVHTHGGQIYIKAKLPCT